MARAIADEWNRYSPGVDRKQVITQPNDRFICLEAHFTDSDAMPSQPVLDGIAILSRQIAHELLLAETLPAGSGSQIMLRVQGMPVTMRFIPDDLVLYELGELAKLFAFAARPRPTSLRVGISLVHARKDTLMPEFRMTFIVLQQQTGMFADTRDAVAVACAKWLEPAWMKRCRCRAVLSTMS